MTKKCNSKDPYEDYNQAQAWNSKMRAPHWGRGSEKHLVIEPTPLVPSGPGTWFDPMLSQ